VAPSGLPLDNPDRQCRAERCARLADIPRADGFALRGCCARLQ
jgi:hypothetical protein